MTLVPVKKKRLSKKNKISWRKNIDISDVDKFMDDQRLEERVGKVTDKKDEELFIIDTVPEASKKQRETVTEKRKRKALRFPTCFSSLINSSKVQDPVGSRNKIRTDDSRKLFKRKLIEESNIPSEKFSTRVQQSIKDRLKSYDRLDDRKKKQRKVFDSDIWSDDKEIKTQSQLNSQWVEKNCKLHNLANLGKAVVQVPKSMHHKRSQLKAIATPNSGMSYNPTFKDHQKLIDAVVIREEKVIKEEEHLNRVTTAMFSKVTASERDADREKELKSGIENDDQEDENITDDDLVYKPCNPPVKVKPKDVRARRNQREQREIRNNLLEIKREKKKIGDIHRLKYLKEDVQVVEMNLKDMRARKVIRRKKKLFAPRRIGRVIFKEEEIPIQLPEDISGNLRNVKSVGSILSDRFKSLQKRNMLAPTVDLGLRRRREIKRFVRKSHKEEETPIRAEKKK